MRSYHIFDGLSSTHFSTRISDRQDRLAPTRRPLVALRHLRSEWIVHLRRALSSTSAIFDAFFDGNCLERARTNTKAAVSAAAIAW